MARISALIFVLTLYTGLAVSAELDRPEFNYMMLCQGCHLPDAMGYDNRVPRINNFIGHFLKVEGGREYLARVPGAANAALNDEQLAELMNWIIVNFSGESMPDTFTPYSNQEINKLRSHPLSEVVEHRKLLVNKIDRLNNNQVH